MLLLDARDCVGINTGESCIVGCETYMRGCTTRDFSVMAMVLILPRLASLVYLRSGAAGLRGNSTYTCLRGNKWDGDVRVLVVFWDCAIAISIVICIVNAAQRFCVCACLHGMCAVAHLHGAMRATVECSCCSSSQPQLLRLL